MKKKTATLLAILALCAQFSCGPKRHGCGPGRRCEIKLPQKQMGSIETKTFLC